MADSRIIHIYSQSCNFCKTQGICEKCEHMSCYVHSACAPSESRRAISLARMVQKSQHTVLYPQWPAREHAVGHRHAWLPFEEVRSERLDELPLDLDTHWNYAESCQLKECSPLWSCLCIEPSLKTICENRRSIQTPGWFLFSRNFLLCGPG